MTTQNILSMQVQVSCLADATQRIVELATRPTGSYVCVSNVHMCMETFDSPEFCEMVNGADLVVADGKPISIAQRLLGHRGASQVRGQDLMHALCELSTKSQLKIGFYGGRSTSLLQTVESNLTKRYPKLSICFAFAPPFRALTPQEDREVIAQIEAAGVDILFVGIGCPKQEIWMAEHKSQLSCVMLGVGAAFDFIAGEKKSAPRWMQHFSLEWLFRLCSEPRRLWKRYLHQNPRFLFYYGKQLGKSYFANLRSIGKHHE